MGRTLSARIDGEKWWNTQEVANGRGGGLEERKEGALKAFIKKYLEYMDMKRMEVGKIEGKAKEILCLLPILIVRREYKRG
jgi:hypothetical protein